LFFTLLERQKVFFYTIVSKRISREGIYVVYINSRCKKILEMLLNAEYYTSLKQITEELGVSKRSIYYDICKLNEWLTYYNVSELEIIRGKGIIISKKDKQKINMIVY